MCLIVDDRGRGPLTSVNTRIHTCAWIRFSGLYQGCPYDLAMNRVPAMWSIAYGQGRSAAIRLIAHCALRVCAIVCILAQTDHYPFIGL